MSKNNPIQHRLNKLLQEWKKAINTPDIKIVRILSKPDEEDMVDAFFEYLLAIDTDIDDFTMIFDSPLHNLSTFSNALLEEFTEEIEQWNTAKIPDNFSFNKIEWKANYAKEATETKNVAQTFINNMNTFANYAFSEKDKKVCLVVKMYDAQKKDAFKWLQHTLECNWEPHIIIAITDTEDFPLHNTITNKFSEHTYTIVPNLDMDSAVEELAAQTDPSLPENAYRNALLKLMNAVKARNSKKAENYAKECLKIATKKIKKDANWLAQIVTVYTVLYNNELGFKNYNDALYFADKATEAALISRGAIDDTLAYRLVGQTHMGRGGLHFLSKNYNDAVNDYLKAEKAYAFCKDYLMQCDALRLAADTCIKITDKNNALAHYSKAYGLINKLMPEVLKNSTFPLVVKALLKHDYKRLFITKEQLNNDLKPIFGTNWEEIIEAYGNYKKAS